MVTLSGCQNFSEFELHARAVLGYPIPVIKQEKVGASAVVLSQIEKQGYPDYTGIEEALKEEDTDVRIFGKPFTRFHRRMGVVVCSAPLGSDINALRDKCKGLAAKITVI